MPSQSYDYKKIPGKTPLSSLASPCHHLQASVRAPTDESHSGIRWEYAMMSCVWQPARDDALANKTEWSLTEGRCIMYSVLRKPLRLSRF